MSELLIFILWTNNITWKEKIFYLVFTEMHAQGMHRGVKTLFICNDIDKNLNKNFHT